MIGQLCNGQDKLVYTINLDNQMPREHALRGIDHFLDRRDLRRHLVRFYSPMGRPSIDPKSVSVTCTTANIANLSAFDAAVAAGTRHSVPHAYADPLPLSIAGKKAVVEPQTCFGPSCFQVERIALASNDRKAARAASKF